MPAGGSSPACLQSSSPGFIAGAAASFGGSANAGRCEVEVIGHRVGVGVAVGERREVPLALDEGEDRGVVLDHVGDVVAARPRRDHEQRHTEAIAVEATRGQRHIRVRERGRIGDRSDAVGRDRSRRGHMVVVAAVLVVGDEQSRLVPEPRPRQRADDLSDEALANLDVLGVLLRGDVVVRVEERERGQAAARRITEEAAHRTYPRGATR